MAYLALLVDALRDLLRELLRDDLSVGEGVRFFKLLDNVSLPERVRLRLCRGARGLGLGDRNELRHVMEEGSVPRAGLVISLSKGIAQAIQ